MATNGQLVFTDVDKVTFKGVGNTSNAVIDTTTGKIGVGVDSPDANLHVLGNCFVSTNFELGGTMSMGTVTVRAQHELSAITATGNTTPHTVEFQNATTGFVTTANVEVGTANLFVDTSTSNVGIGTNAPIDTLHINGGTRFAGHIIPTTNATFDIGSAENKVRDLYVDTNSIWVGDRAKIAFENGKMKFKRRKLNKVPRMLVNLAISGGRTDEADVETHAIAFAQTKDASISTVSDLKLEHIRDYAKTFDNTKSVSDIFADNEEDYEAITASEAFMEVGSNIFTEHSLSIGKTTDPTSALDVVGDTKISSNLAVGTANLFVDTVNSRVGIGTADPETKLDIRGRVHQEDGRYTFDFENLRPHFIDTLSEFRYVAMMNDDAEYIIPNSGTILYEYNPSTDTTSTVITSTTNDNTVGIFTITAGREYYTNDMNPIVFVGGNDGTTSSSGNAYNGHHTIVPYIYNGYYFGLKNSRYEDAYFFIYAPYENVTVNVYINKGIQDTPDHTISITRQTVTQWIKVADGISANYNITFEAVGGRILMSKYGYGGSIAGDHCILKPGSDLSYNFCDHGQAINSHDLFGRVEYISDAYTFSSPSGVPVFNTSIGDGDGGNLVTQHPMELVGDVYYSPHALEGFAILFMHPSQSITVEYLTASNGSWQQYEVIASPSKKASIHYPVYISRGRVATSITQELDKTPDNIDFTATEKAYVAWKFTSNRGTFLVRFESSDHPNSAPFEDEYTPFGWLDSTKTYKIHKTIRPTTPFFLKSYLNTGIDLNDPLQSDGVTAAAQGGWYYRNVVGTSFSDPTNPMYDNINDYFKSIAIPSHSNIRDIQVPVPGLWRISIHVIMITSALDRNGSAISNLRNSIGVRPVVSGYSLPEYASMGYIRNYDGQNVSTVYMSTIDMINTERRTVNVQFNRITSDTNHIVTVGSGSFILLEKL